MNISKLLEDAYRDGQQDRLNGKGGIDEQWQRSKTRKSLEGLDKGDKIK